MFLTVLCLSLAKAIRDGEITRLMLRSLVLMLVENNVAKAIRDGAIKAKIDHANGWLIYRRRLETFTLQQRGSNPKPLQEKWYGYKSSYSLQAPNLASITRPDVSYDSTLKNRAWYRSPGRPRYFGHVFVSRCFIISRD